jgi:coenzyme F420-0:L-glutamate ligase/coenzyme F420-1:gamma-L-glutamate ligase
MQVIPVRIAGDVQAGADIAELVVSSLARNRQKPRNGDVLVIAHKIVSKAEGRIVDLSAIRPSAKARRIAARQGKDPRIAELILRESTRIVKMHHGVIITETRHGFICANSGVDQSNVRGDRAALLPKDPDGSAKRIRRTIRRRTGKDIAVIIADTFGRPFREGQVNVAIGIAGLKPISDYRGTQDLFGRKLRVTEIAVADEIASCAELVMGKTDRVPVAIVRGLRYEKGEGSVKELLRKRKNDLFR